MTLQNRYVDDNHTAKRDFHTISLLELQHVLLLVSFGISNSSDQFIVSCTW